MIQFSKVVTEKPFGNFHCRHSSRSFFFVEGVLFECNLKGLRLQGKIASEKKHSGTTSDKRHLPEKFSKLLTSHCTF